MAKASVKDYSSPRSHTHKILELIASPSKARDLQRLLFSVQELQEENRTLKRQIARQERDLARYTGAEGDLPVILRSH